MAKTANYATREMVKRRIGLLGGETPQNIDIDDALNFADGLIDSYFALIDKTVPATTPQMIKDASAEIATYWLVRKSDATKAASYFNMGIQLVQQYIKSQHQKDIGVFITPSHTDSLTE